MTLEGSGVRARHRGAGLALLAVAVAGACPAPASAQEPLVIRIRPRPEPGADAALAARDALWARRQAHARAVLASICEGCLSPWRPEPPAVHRAPAAAALAGLETDPAPGASGPPADPANTQERP